MEDSALSNISGARDVTSEDASISPDSATAAAASAAATAQSHDQTQKEPFVSSSDMMRFRTFSPLVPLASKNRNRISEHYISNGNANWRGVQPVTSSVTDSTLHDRISSVKSMVSRSDWTIGTFSVSNVENSVASQYHAQLPASQRRKFTIPHAREESTTMDTETPSSFPENGSAQVSDDLYKTSNYLSSLTDWGTVRLNSIDPMKTVYPQLSRSPSSTTTILSNSRTATIANLHQSGCTATKLFAREVEARQEIDQKYFRGLLRSIRKVFSSDALRDVRLQLEETAVAPYALQLCIQEHYWRECIAETEREEFNKTDHEFEIVNSIIGIAGGAMRRALCRWIWRRRQKRNVFLMRVKRISDAEQESRRQLCQGETDAWHTLIASLITVQENDFRCAMVRIVLIAHVMYARIEVTWAEHLEWYDMLFHPPHSNQIRAIPHSLDADSLPSGSSSDESRRNSDSVRNTRSDSMRDAGRAVPLAFRLVFLEETHGRECIKAKYYATYPIQEADRGEGQ